MQDESKGDMLSKGPVLGMVCATLQCLARAVEHFPITELETVTLASLASALVNLVTYMLWWNKPQNVE